MKIFYYNLIELCFEQGLNIEQTFEKLMERQREMDIEQARKDFNDALLLHNMDLEEREKEIIEANISQNKGADIDLSQYTEKEIAFMKFIGRLK